MITIIVHALLLLMLLLLFRRTPSSNVSRAIQTGENENEEDKNNSQNDETNESCMTQLQGDVIVGNNASLIGCTNT